MRYSRVFDPPHLILVVRRRRASAMWPPESELSRQGNWRLGRVRLGPAQKREPVAAGRTVPVDRVWLLVYFAGFLPWNGLLRKVNELQFVSFLVSFPFFRSRTVSR